MSVYDFFFFKQKTAYEMRISDWSSDVCSSDLDGRRRHVLDGSGAGQSAAVGQGGDPRLGFLSILWRHCRFDRDRRFGRRKEYQRFEKLWRPHFRPDRTERKFFHPPDRDRKSTRLNSSP